MALYCRVFGLAPGLAAGLVAGRAPGRVRAGAVGGAG
jgi:hypothetical protein